MVGPVTIHKQLPPKAKGSGLGSVVILKSAGTEMMLYLRDSAAKWKLPLTELTLRGKFVKEQWTDKTVLTCEDLTQPEGAMEWPAEEIVTVAAVVKPSVKDCLEAGVRCADFMLSKKRPELAQAAFTFGANALLSGAKLE